MASLRKRVEAAPSAPPPSGIAIDTNAAAPPVPQPPPPPSPVPEPVTPLSDAATALTSQLEALRQAETYQQQKQQAVLSADQRRRDWLAANPMAQQNLAALDNFHHAALNSGLADTSPEYFSFLETQLGDLQAQQPATAATHLINEMQQRIAAQTPPPPPPPRPQARPSFVSAPVSREIPTANGRRQSGKTDLSPQEREAARISGVSEVEYAKQKLRFLEMQANGEYSDRR